MGGITVTNIHPTETDAIRALIAEELANQLAPIIASITAIETHVNEVAALVDSVRGGNGILAKMLSLKSG